MLEAFDLAGQIHPNSTYILLYLGVWNSRLMWNNLWQMNIHVTSTWIWPLNEVWNFGIGRILPETIVPEHTYYQFSRFNTCLSTFKDFKKNVCHWCELCVFLAAGTERTHVGMMFSDFCYRSVVRAFVGKEKVQISFILFKNSANVVWVWKITATVIKQPTRGWDAVSEKLVARTSLSEFPEICFPQKWKHSKAWHHVHKTVPDNHRVTPS